MAERSKAPVSGTGLFGGVGSNPTPIIYIFFFLDPLTRIPNLVLPGETISTVGWPSGPRRQFKALVSSEAWVRIPLQSYIPVSLVGQDTRLSPVRPGFKSRTGNFFFFTAPLSRTSGGVEVGVKRKFRACVPPELRWQSGRLLTARSSVRSRVEAHHFSLAIFFFLSREVETELERRSLPFCSPGVAQR